MVTSPQFEKLGVRTPCGPIVILMMMREGCCVTAEKIICKPVNVEVVTESMFPLTVVMSLV